MVTHAASALLVYLTLNAITWFCYDESIWTVLFMAATGYIAQDIAGTVKTLARQIEWVNSFSRQQGGGGMGDHGRRRAAHDIDAPDKILHRAARQH